MNNRNTLAFPLLVESFLLSAFCQLYVIRPHSFILLDLNLRKVNNIKKSTDAVLVANKETTRSQC